MLPYAANVTFQLLTFALQSPDGPVAASGASSFDFDSSDDDEDLAAAKAVMRCHYHIVMKVRRRPGVV